MAKKNTTEPLFEQSLSELETLVEEMEKGNLDLETSLQHFERGINLTRSCQNLLQNAEQKVQVLLTQNEDAELAPFERDPEQ